MSLDKKNLDHTFFCAFIRFKVQSFFLFLKIMFLCAAHKDIKMTLDKKNHDYIFFLCVYAFSIAKIQLSQKVFFLFVKIEFLCTAHKNIKMTHDKKITTTSFFCASMQNLCIVSPRSPSFNFTYRFKLLYRTLVMYLLDKALISIL